MSSNIPAAWPVLALAQPSGQGPSPNALLYTSQSALVCPWTVGAPGSMTDYVYAFAKDEPGWDGVQRLVTDCGWEIAAEEAADATKPDEWVVLRISASTWTSDQLARAAGTKR